MALAVDLTAVLAPFTIPALCWSQNDINYVKGQSTNGSVANVDRPLKMFQVEAVVIKLAHTIIVLLIKIFNLLKSSGLFNCQEKDCDG